MRRTLASLALPALLVLAAPPAGAWEDVFEDLSDQVTVVVLGRQVVAVDARTGRPIGERLEIEEDVTAHGAQGLVGAAETPRRLLGFSARTRRWEEARLRLGEQAPHRGGVSLKLALYYTDEAVYVFDGAQGRWSTLRLPPGEVVLEAGVGRNVAALVTERRAIAYSARSGGFHTEGVFLRRTAPHLAVGDNTATVLEEGRVLTFGAGAHRWTSTPAIRFD